MSLLPNMDNNHASGNFSDLLLEFAAETNTGKLLERILQAARNITRADGGTIYLLNETAKQPELAFALMINETLKIHRGGFGGEEIDLPPIAMYLPDGRENFHNVVSHCALTKKIVCIEDAYHVADFDFSGTRRFDEQFSYHSQSFLTVPLLNHDHEVIGVLQLLNATDDNGQVTSFSADAVEWVTGLAGYAAIALNNVLLVKELKTLLDAFVQWVAQAIDAKSPYTSAHCRRIPLLMELMAAAACKDTGKFKDFRLDEDEWYELKVASWLHDCGKLSTPDMLLEKSSKLHLLQDGIATIKIRFEAAKLAVERDYYQSMFHGTSDAEWLQNQCQTAIKRLNEDLAFVMAANKGGEFMSAADKYRLADIARQTWINSEGEEQVLLTQEELDFLCIEKGTLSSAERNTINNHIVVTIDMLESLPFPRKLKRVPEYAGGHHEKMDGTGYPKGLRGEEMSIPARMMAIADIFEALTSRDRPYKEPMKISQSLAILQRMKDSGHIDPDLYDLFVNTRVWEDYARRELLPEQLDM